ncbi:MAG: hypothetical protein J6J87_09315, partial [Oscillospiraceae bacterium]|nr:hypothetical protein [Oscillospiraceae bacterium]
PEARREGEGIRLPVETGWLYVVPITRKRALRVIAEAVSTEAADELCALGGKELRELDEKGQKP